MQVCFFLNAADVYSCIPLSYTAHALLASDHAARPGQQADATVWIVMKGCMPDLHSFASATGSSRIHRRLFQGIHAFVQVEDKEGETPLSMAAKHGKLRDLMVQVATGQMDVDEIL